MIFAHYGVSTGRIAHLPLPLCSRFTCAQLVQFTMGQSRQMPGKIFVGCLKYYSLNDLIPMYVYVTKLELYWH